MKPGTKCPIDQLEFIDEENNNCIIKCYDDDGLSKGLLALAYELNIFVPKKCRLHDLRLLLSEHAAFRKVKSSF